MDEIKCKGFLGSGGICGIKKNGAQDLGILYSKVKSNAAAVFTKNKIKAAPLILNEERIKSGICQAIIVNSGNANCCTGIEGINNAKKMAKALAEELQIPENLVLTASTGVIGEPLPIDKIQNNVPETVKALSEEGLNDFAMAIMTTDIFPKIVNISGEINGNEFNIVGMAKGSGMIHPNMATMLCFLCTDIKISSSNLHKTLISAVDKSFNRISVDGDTSTNDMVIIMANGLSDASAENPSDIENFQKALDEVSIKLAKMIVKDGEGATKLIEIHVKGALSNEDAHKIANTIATSNLVKTAFFGEDANWGRILGAAGRADVPIEPDKIDLFFDDIMIVKDGMRLKEYSEEMTSQILKKAEFTVTIDLNMRKGESSVYTCDFSIDYVKINADYRS
ncbi:MAG: bifunctional glutamate N-acetyltransferase/amino-acid acetyltransferase ArgJ [Desulfobacterales bacterium]|nr:bifunctional glutamate N-acetyltransferase/amino-acid acetyltransferase ArgJ [Desulfobacterales bacterium]